MRADKYHEERLYLMQFLNTVSILVCFCGHTLSRLSLFLNCAHIHAKQNETAATSSVFVSCQSFYDFTTKTTQQILTLGLAFTSFAAH